MNILVVEDHVDSATALARALRLRGHFVEIATTYNQAKRIFADSDFELVITDISLPDGNGCDLLHELINVRDVKVIAMTGLAMPHELEAVNAAGFEASLVKPFSIAELLKTIEAAAVGRGASPPVDTRARFKN